MDWLRELTPVIAIWGIGLNLLFQGFRWIEEADTKRDLGIWATTCGLALILAGLAAYAVIEWNSLCCAVLDLLLSGGIIYGIYFGIRFALKKGAFRKK